MSTDRWGIIHAERQALAADLQGLTEPQWATPSLCTGWSVRDVLARYGCDGQYDAATVQWPVRPIGIQFRKPASGTGSG